MAEQLRDSERIVITGMGIVSPIGHDVESNWQALLNGEHGVERIDDTIIAGYGSLPVHVAATVKDFDLMSDPFFGDSSERKKSRKKWDMSQQFMLWAGSQALKDAGLIKSDALSVDSSVLDLERFGVVVGTGVGGASKIGEIGKLLEKEREELERAIESGDQELVESLLGETRLRPTEILNILPGRVAGAPALTFQARAFWEGVLLECASGNGAIISAAKAIRNDEADVVLAGGTEGFLNPVTIGTFGVAGAVSPSKEPDEASRPLDEARTGLVMGQGAGGLVVERKSHADKRGARIHAELIGYARGSDAKHETEPDPERVMMCIKKAMLKAGAVGKSTVNMHATSTVIGDIGEMEAVSQAFPATDLVGIAATKSMTGHTLGAAGAIEAIYTILSLNKGKTPPIRNLVNPIEQTKGYEHLMSADGPIEHDADSGVNLSFGFGGNNAVTVFAKPS